MSFAPELPGKTVGGKGHWKGWATRSPLLPVGTQAPRAAPALFPTTDLLNTFALGGMGGDRVAAPMFWSQSSLSQGHGARSPLFPVHSSRSSTRQPRSRNAALATSSQSGWEARACEMSSSAPRSRMGLEKAWLRDTKFRISMQACFWKRRGNECGGLPGVHSDLSVLLRA